jgi:hypothetical protein
MADVIAFRVEQLPAVACDSTITVTPSVVALMVDDEMFLPMTVHVPGADSLLNSMVSVAYR